VQALQRCDIMKSQEIATEKLSLQATLEYSQSTEYSILLLLLLLKDLGYNFR